MGADGGRSACARHGGQRHPDPNQMNGTAIDASAANLNASLPWTFFDVLVIGVERPSLSEVCECPLTPIRAAAVGWRSEGANMAITIAEAARQWRVARETIYRRQLAGELEFATIDPPTVDASEMLRAFGEPKAAADKPAATDVVALTRIEAICEALKAAAEYLMAELATMRRSCKQNTNRPVTSVIACWNSSGTEASPRDQRNFDIAIAARRNVTIAAGRDVTIAARRNGGGPGGACRSATRRDPPDKMKNKQ